MEGLGKESFSLQVPSDEGLKADEEVCGELGLETGREVTGVAH